MLFMGSLSIAAADTEIPALAATKDVAVTEYDEAALEKFKDNTLEYWELPGLIERYNTDYQNQLQKYYYNPGGSTGLTRDQMSAMAADLRAEADISPEPETDTSATGETASSSSKPNTESPLVQAQFYLSAYRMRLLLSASQTALLRSARSSVSDYAVR